MTKITKKKKWYVKKLVGWAADSVDSNQTPRILSYVIGVYFVCSGPSVSVLRLNAESRVSMIEVEGPEWMQTLVSSEKLSLDIQCMYKIHIPKTDQVQSVTSKSRLSINCFYLVMFWKANYACSDQIASHRLVSACIAHLCLKTGFLMTWIISQSAYPGLYA